MHGPLTRVTAVLDLVRPPALDASQPFFEPFRGVKATAQSLMGQGLTQLHAFRAGLGILGLCKYGRSPRPHEGVGQRKSVFLVGHDLDGLTAVDHVRVDNHNVERPVKQRHIPACDAFALYAIAGALRSAVSHPPMPALYSAKATGAWTSTFFAPDCRVIVVRCDSLCMLDRR